MHPAVNCGPGASRYHAALHYLKPPPHQQSAKLVDTRELSPSYNYCRLAKVNMAPVSYQEWHPGDSVLLELADDKHLADRLIADSTSQFNTIEGST